MPLPVKPIDIHTHPFTEETVYGHGPSFTEGHDFFGSVPESPSHAWAAHRQLKSMETMTRDLRAAGVEKAVVVNMVASHTWGRSLPNDFIAKYCREFPDLLVGFGGVDPHMDTRAAVQEVERCKQELGLSGLKFHPAYQAFYPNDRERAYPIYEKCVELDMPILVHTGTTRMTRCTIRPCKPEYVDEVATDFPTLTIIMTHFNWPWVEEGLAVVWRHEHVYLDLSGWLPRYVYATSPVVFQYWNTFLQDKMVFGSDYPALHPKAWIEDFEPFLENGFEWGGRKRRFSREVVEKFFRKNAIRALKLNGLES